MQQLKPVTVPHSPATGEGNLLIDGLPRKERLKLLALCDHVELVPGAVLCQVDEPFDHVYFPVIGCISLVRSLDGRVALDTELIGCEGMLGVTLVLGVPCAPQRGRVQSHGRALRMPATQLQSSLEDCPALVLSLKRYLFVVMVQLSQNAGCNRFHDVGARLARGLLMVQDRARSNRFHLTHQSIADMLGVQRGAITLAAGLLQRKNIISYSRGEITILDRGKLVAASCECYAARIGTYTQMLSQPGLLRG